MPIAGHADQKNSGISAHNPRAATAEAVSGLRHERNNRPNAANRAEETLRTSLWQSGTRRC